MRSIASRASRAAAGMYSASCSSASSACGSHVSRRGWRATSPGAAVSDALLDPVPRGGLVDRRDLAAVQVGHDQVQAFPPSVHVQQGLGLVEDPVVFDGVGHGLSVSPGPARTPDHHGTDPGPVFVTERKARMQLPTADLDEHGHARLSYQQAEALFTKASGGATLHQLRHSALTHDAEQGTGTPMLMAYSGHTSVRSLGKYAKVSAEALARHQAERDPARRR